MIDSSPKMLRTILLISTLCAAAYASGQLSIVHYPKSLGFKGNDAVESGSAGDVFAAACGYSVVSSSEWNAMTIRNPFELPRGCFALYFQDAEQVPVVSKASTFNLEGSGSQESIQAALNRIPESEDSPLNTAEGDLEKVTWTALKPETRPDEKAYLQSIAALLALVDEVQNRKVLPSFWVARVRSSQSLAKSGSSPAALAEAKKIENAAIEQLIAALKKAYAQDGVLIAFVADREAAATIRRKRDIDATTADTLNLAVDYNDDYPVIFNILLWFGIVMLFTLVAISYAIGNMDPGRDSIIYRMTSTRMKKDN